MKPIILSGPAIYTEQGIVKEHAVLISADLIQDIVPAENFQSQAMLKFPADYHLVPGFIDCHTHGTHGYDVMDASHKALAAISQGLAREGTTAFLATTMTAEQAQIEATLLAISDYMQNSSERGAQVLGVHLEGPFLAPTKMGAQHGDKIIPPNIDLVQHWQTLSQQAIKLVTLAPEQVNSIELIQYLKQQKIIASMGHTNASYTESMAAIAAGCSHATHLFNAMSGIHQREPGTVTAALLAEQVMVELIVDGIHLHPAIIELVLRMKSKDKIILITDAMRAKCLNDGCYDLGGQKVHVNKGQAQLADGTLAGSVLSMNTAIKNIINFTGCSLFDACKMASENPAKALGIFHHKGSIAPQKDADLVVLDEKLNVVMTICRGMIINVKP